METKDRNWSFKVFGSGLDVSVLCSYLMEKKKQSLKLPKNKGALQATVMGILLNPLWKVFLSQQGWNCG